MKTTTLPPTREQFDAARCSIPAQHPVAMALAEALAYAEAGVNSGLITPEYAHEVLRWVRRSAARMSTELQGAADAIRAGEDARAQNLKSRDRIDRLVFGCTVAIAMLASVGLAFMGATLLAIAMAHF